ncbi:hypothetical protein MFLAVUS_008219 [Mucor flavus]|uniref:Uncharacterized protein n=1 Tax=Mucor flavus TaxID=439312 RepID=A0ABP9Z6K5_9FUNG
MRPTSLYSIQPDPYRNRRSSAKDENSSPTTPKSTTQLIFVPEPGRTHSYLPYSNHAPDFKQSRAELYVEEDTMTLASSHQVDMINGEHTLQQHTFSLTTQDDTINRGHRKISDLCLTDKLRHKRQQKLQQGHFYTPSSKRICIVFCVITVLAVISLIIYFCWPRIPKLVLKSEKVERIGDPADWGPNHQPWLRAAWKLNMTLDNTVNFVPTRINDIELVLMDRDTYIPFAWSRTGPIHLDPYKETLYSLIFRVNYESPSVNDTTFKNLYNACGPQIPTESPVLNAVVHITGLVWSSVLLVRPPEGEGLRCPFN